MTAKLITLVLTLLLFSKTFAQGLPVQNYFPVKTGNSWEYHVRFELLGQTQEDLGFTIARVKQEQLMPNGKAYSQTGSFTFLNDNRWIREDSGRVYFYEEQDSSDNLILDFNASVHDTIKFHKYYHDCMSVLASKELHYALGQNTTVIHYLISYGIDHEYNVWFSEKFGPVEWIISGVTGRTTYSLTGCSVNDSSYGLPVSAGKQNREKAAGFSLSQNYPNPFNPSTVINYSTSEDGHVKLQVFDITGRKVAVLADEVKPAGKYSVKFNGDGLPGGVYFYRLEAGSNASAKKFVLLK